MSKVYFYNQGEFDARAMLTFGMNAKETSNPIGYFGTGFKYAVAIILRLGGSVKVISAGKSYHFTAVEEDFRGKLFNLISCNGQPAGFTTELGKNWEPWQAFRELYCNALDEGGGATDDVSQLADHETIIEVDCPQIHTAFTQRSKYFLSSKPLVETAEVDIHEGATSFIYYRGIKIGELEKRSLYTYNIKATLELTEDRTIKHPFWPQYYIRRTLQHNCHNQEVCRNLVASTAGGNNIESHWGFAADENLSPELYEACKTAFDKKQPMHPALRRILSRKGHADYSTAVLTTVQQLMLKRSITLLSSIGLDMTLYEICPVLGLPAQQMGLAENGKIYITPTAFNMGTKQVCSTLLEEWVHLNQDVGDFERRMQSWLFDKIISLAEEQQGEPL